MAAGERVTETGTGMLLDVDTCTEARFCGK